MKRLAIHKTVIIIATGLTVVALNGCADIATKPGSTPAAAAVDNTKKLKAITVMPTRLPNEVKISDCPVSPTSWHKEDLSKILAMANACSQYKKLERLEELANFMAQNFVIEPWGAFYLSVAAEQRKDFARALWMIELAIKKSPHNGLLYYQRGRVHWQLNETGLAVEDYNLAVKDNNSIADAHLVLAQYYTRANNLKSAEQHYQQLALLEPENFAVLAAYAEIEVSLDHGKFAIELFERAASASPRNVEYRLRLGHLYEENQKNYEQALTAYRNAKSIMSAGRTPADARTAEVNDKIKKLEALLNPEPKEGPKVTTAQQPSQAQVKK